MAQVMHYGVHLTRCIDPANYAPLPPEGVGFVTVGPASFGKKICDYLLYGKLVCMASEPVCVIGTIVGLEHTSYGKSGPDAIDNDFSFNLLLAPFRPKDLRRYAVASVNQHIIFRHVAKHAPQGELIEDRAGRLAGLVPREPAPESPVDGYGVMWHFPDDGADPTTASDPDEKRQANLNKLKGVTEAGGVTIPIPVLHCEAEGSRIFAVCTALAPFLDILSGKLPGSPRPVGHGDLPRHAGLDPVLRRRVLRHRRDADRHRDAPGGARRGGCRRSRLGGGAGLRRPVLDRDGVAVPEDGRRGRRAGRLDVGLGARRPPRAAPGPGHRQADGRGRGRRSRGAGARRCGGPPEGPQGPVVPAAQRRAAPRGAAGCARPEHARDADDDAAAADGPHPAAARAPVDDPSRDRRLRAARGRRGHPRGWWALNTTDTSLARRLWCPECMLRFGRAILAWTVILGVLTRRRRRR